MTRERYADEPDPGPLLTCHRPPCEGRVYHDQVMHDFLAHNPHPITVDSPLGDLVAGRIDQAEYRRRMADLERHAADRLDDEPAPARRRPPPDRSGMVVVWMAVVFGTVLLAIAVAGILATLAAPRGAQTTDLEPSRDMSASAGVWAPRGAARARGTVLGRAVGPPRRRRPMTTWLADPRTKAPLPALDTERRFLERLRQRELGPRWVPEYENGIPVRLRWVDPRQVRP